MGVNLDLQKPRTSKTNSLYNSLSPSIMTIPRTHYYETYAPRTVSTTLFKSLVEALDQFKPGLNTISRKITSRAISHQKITDLVGIKSWQVIDSHSLAELEHLHTELLLVANATDSCELHIEFRGEHIMVSVSDIQSGMGKPVFEEARRLLKDLGIKPGGWKNYLTKAYTIVTISENVLMIASVAIFSVWLQSREYGYIYVAIGLFISGVMPTLRRLLYHFIPPKRMQLVEVIPTKRRFPWTEITVIFGLLGALISLATEIVAFWTSQ